MSCDHKWKHIKLSTPDRDRLVRICVLCDATEFDMSSPVHISDVQASRLGFDYRDPTTGLLVLTRTGHIDELPV